MGLFSLKGRRLRGDVTTFSSPRYVTTEQKESFVAVSLEQDNTQWAFTAANFRLVFTAVRTAKCKNRRSKKATGQLLPNIFQDVRQTCQVFHNYLWSCFEVGRQIHNFLRCCPLLLTSVLYGICQKKINTKILLKYSSPFSTFFPHNLSPQKWLISTFIWVLAKV